MAEHANADVLRGMAEGQKVLARLGKVGDFTPIEDCSTTALHALFKGSSPGLELQGKWEFALLEADDDPVQDDSRCHSCDGTGEGQFEGQSCTACRGRGY